MKSVRRARMQVMGLRIDDPAAALADSGLVALTGWPDGPPIVPPLDLAVRLEALAAEIEARSGALLRPVRLSWQAAVAGRAALLGLSRRGQTSANGSCRLIPALDGWVAINLPRPDDLELIPALVGGTVTDPWQAVAAEAARLPAEEFVARGRLLGLAAAALGSTSTSAGTGAASGPDLWTAVRRWPPSRPGAMERRLRVVDLSSLWAGPIVGRVLAEAGAQVTKVESSARRDAARENPPFYGWLHARDERTVVVNLRDPKGWQRAADLIDDADVVIEASRPRALEQLGLGPDDRPERAGRMWLSITGHGREPPGRDWVAFGDDAAVAGGLVGRDASGEPVFCGDAIADPVTGLAGAAAVLRALETGGGQLIDLAMSRAARFAAGTRRSAGPGTVEPSSSGGWEVRSETGRVSVREGPPNLEWIAGGDTPGRSSFFR